MPPDPHPCEEPDCALHDSPDPVAARLAAIRERMPEGDLRLLLNVVDAALLDLHHPVNRGRTMHSCYGCGHPWPCLTWSTATAVLLGKED